ncbi:hypothetical protein EUGRSUZ_G01492 [Eucalyptus grandis]|uniref:RRM domain-containing protein n=2 Tax=Eucalyptus grandis TaxID=71139 RepID=A0A059BD47_EUCGR|nr:hypothetical protein EUGRSUZ_G01492 [Eucalyptus grandis]
MMAAAAAAAGGGMMQYPAAAMAMMQQQQQQQQQQMMLYPHHYLPYHYQQLAPQHHGYQQGYHQQQQGYHQKPQQQPRQQPPQYQQQQLQQGASGSDDAKTIWIGDLHHWMDETYLHNCFSHTGEVSSVKVIRNKQTGQSEGYGFVEFSSHATAEKVLQSYNGTSMPNTEQPFRLNWAMFSSGDKRLDMGSDLSIFVGDLASDVTDALLQETFAAKYTSVKGAKVVIDSNTGRSKGYGFVRFGDENEKSRAMTEMNGAYCSSRPMRIGVATPKKSSGYQQQYSSQALVLAGGHAGGHASNGATSQGSQAHESNNSTIFVGGLDSDVSDEDLRQTFSQFGEVVSVKIPAGKGCGFVHFADRKNAEEAMQDLNGTTIGKQSVRLSWGRSPANKQWRTERSNQWNGSYHGGYANGYAATSNQDSSLNVAAVANGVM